MSQPSQVAVPLQNTVSSSPPSPHRTLWVQLREASRSVQPLTTGVALPPGLCPARTSFRLLAPQDEALPLQTSPLTHWPDGSVQWLRVEALCPPLPAGTHRLRLEASSPDAPSQAASDSPPTLPTTLAILVTERTFEVQTGVATFVLNRSIFSPLQQVRRGERSCLEEPLSRLLLLNAEGHPCPPMLYSSRVESQGPLSATLHFEGRFGGMKGLRFEARATFWGGTGLYRLDLTLHNPRRASHPGGLWDLGDEGSLFFKEVALSWMMSEQPGVLLQPEPNLEALPLTTFSLVQASSGGERWKSPNHLNRHGAIPLEFRGYRLQASGTAAPARTWEGLRALPRVQLQSDAATLTLGLPTFWQEFPKALSYAERELTLGLFPHQHTDPFELQGGERKTHTIWLELTDPSRSGGLEWLASPAAVIQDAQELEAAGAIPWFRAQPLEAPESDLPRQDRLETLLRSAVEGPENLFLRREPIDEYGWRHFGDVYGDHEQRHFEGPDLAISHFNNQYDLLHGLILCGLRATDGRYFSLAGALARHVQDIDLYHTQEDKAAYNGGLFWHTDHYLSAQTATHRTFSVLNARGRTDYGGGPSAQHNATSGLLLWYWLSGDPQAREAVLELASWVVAMDDGSQNILGVLSDAPTGWATSTFDFFGPGRGAGYSLLALLDAWLLTGEARWITTAERLIRRTVHPHDDVSALDLLNAEPRWSYTIFLSALARYLELKLQHDARDAAFAYGQASLVHYALWMLEHEYPYFDRKETLVYPTETWLGQEMRKANVLRMAARHVDEPLRTRLLEKGNALAERAWSDLLTFESRSCTRSLAIWTQEGPRDEALRAPQAPAWRPPVPPPFGEPTRFVPQRQALKAALRDPKKAAEMLLKAAQPGRWLKLLGKEGSIKP